MEPNVSKEPRTAGAGTPLADDQAQEDHFRVTVRGYDYRAVRFMAVEWSPLRLWGLDLFFWHIPLCKTFLVLNALIVWWLA